MGKDKKKVEKSKKKFQETSNSKYNSKGITLVALVITIIILIILATVTINFTFGNNGLIKSAEDAKGMYANDTNYTEDSITNIESYLDDLLGDGNSSVDNPYEEEEWTYAYVCNDGVWDNTQYTAGQQVEGDIIAKFYATEAYLMQYISTGSVPSFSCIMPYVTEITICDGITNIGNLAFAGDTSLNKITISNSVENMGTFILLGSSVTSIICTDGTITL